MDFNVNSSFLYIVASCVIIFVLAQSVFFLVRAYKRGKELGMDKKKINKTILSTAIFTIAPAVSILIGVVTLSKALGIPLPWIRMSVIGALTYELPAAEATASVLGISLEETITDPKIYTAIAFDSGGVASGPLTSTFILPFAIGACMAFCPDGSKVLTDAFGVVAMVAMTPLITIQLLGFRSVVSKIMREKIAMRRILDENDDQIINFM